MTLELKFSVGDTAYTIIGHKAYEVVINKTKIVLQGKECHHKLINYEFLGGPHGFGEAEEKYLFASKEELIDSL